MYTRFAVVCGAAALAVAGCGHSGSDDHGSESPDLAANVSDMSMKTSTSPPAAALPLVTPPVRAAAPSGFQSTNHRAKFQPLSLSADDIASRFFGAGPTDIFNILQSIDDRVSGINQTIAAGGTKCLALTPVAFTLQTPGAATTMWAQCSQTVGSSDPSDPGFLEFGQKDGVTYLYQAIGQGESAAIVTPLAADADGGVTSDDGGAGGAYTVEAWLSVGTLNAATSCGGNSTWDGCSYGVIHLWANSLTRQFEMTVAGVGFGYCGAQLRSDGSVIYVTGSTDMGTTCDAVDNLCVAASDATTPGSCDAATTSFALAPLGREAATGTSQSFGASQYPESSADNVALDGTTSDAVHFGPTAPAAGTDSVGG
jgi:hypothetical protein